MPGQSRIAQPISPPPNIDPAPSNPFPARPCRFRCSTATPSAIGAGSTDVTFDTVLEDTAFGGPTAPFTDITFPRRGLWEVQAQIYLPSTGTYVVNFIETTATDTFSNWFQFNPGFDFIQFPVAPSIGGAAPSVCFASFHIDIPTATVVTFKVAPDAVSPPGGGTVEVNLSMERTSYGGTAALT